MTGDDMAASRAGTQDSEGEGASGVALLARLLDSAVKAVEARGGAWGGGGMELDQPSIRGTAGSQGVAATWNRSAARS